jgi:hypothetical protein
MQMLVIGHLAQIIVLLSVNQQLFFPLGHAKSSSWSCCSSNRWRQAYSTLGAKDLRQAHCKELCDLAMGTWPHVMCLHYNATATGACVWYCWINSWELTVSTTKVRDMICDPDAEHRFSYRGRPYTIQINQPEMLLIDYLHWVEQLSSRATFYPHALPITVDGDPVTRLPTIHHHHLLVRKDKHFHSA